MKTKGRSRRPVRVGLFPKIALAMALVATIPLLAAFFVFTRVLHNRELVEARSTLASLNQRAGDEVLRITLSRAQALQSLAGVSLVRSRSLPPSLRASLLADFRANLSVVADLTILDLQGRVIYSTDSSFRGNWAESLAYQSAARGTPAFSELPAPPRTPKVYVQAAPLVDDQGQWGVMAGQANRADVGTPARDLRVGSQGYGFLLDDTGVVIAHMDQGLVGSVWRGAPLLTHAANGWSWVDLGGDTLLCVYRWLKIPDMVGPQWGTVACQPRSEVFAAGASSRSLLLWALFASLGFATLVGFAFSRSLSKPIRALAASAQAIRGGRLDHRAPTSSSDEVGDLARSFNDMAQALADKIDELQRERTTLSAIQSSMTEGLVVLDSHGRTVTLNEAARTSLGLGPIVVDGRPAAELLAGPHPKLEPVETLRAMLASLRDPSVPVATFHLTLGPGPARHLDFTVFPIRFEKADAMTGILVRDVTREWELEQRRNTFVSVASHELRTPLTTMMGYTELLLEKDPPINVRKRWLRHVYDGTRRLTDIVDDLLNVSRIQSGKLTTKRERLPLREVLEEALAQVRASSDKHEFSIVLGPGTPDVVADRNKLNQVLVNLLDNAVKYSPNGGRVTLRAFYDPSRAKVVLSVTDDGMGISPEDQENLFNTFQRVRRPETDAIKGSGLGLYIVKGLTNLMQGEVWVTSVLDKGSTFYVALPAAPIEART